MRKISFFISILLICTSAGFGQAKSVKKSAFLKFKLNIENGTNHSAIQNYLRRNPKVDLFSPLDTIFKLNLVQVAVFPKIGEPVKSGFEIKSDKDILMILEIFIRERPELSVNILKVALKGIIKWNSYLYVPYTYAYLHNNLSAMNQDIGELIQSDSIANSRWKNWKNCK